MRTILTFLAFGFFAISSPAQVITGFGSAELNPLTLPGDFKLSWTGSQSATTVSIVDQSNAFGGIAQNLSTPVTLETMASLWLTGTAQSVPATTQFRIVLYDNSANSMVATYQWSDFSGGASVSTPLVADSGTFNGTVSSWELILDGSPAEEVSFTFDELSAVPEPATVALVGLALVGLMIRARKLLASAKA